MARSSSRGTRSYTPSRGRFAGRTFASDHEYRSALARGSGFQSRAAQRQTIRAVRSASTEAKLSPATRDARERALEALALMRREGLPLRQAARQAETRPETVKRYAGSALRQSPGGRYRAAKHDRLYRSMRFLTPEGQIALGVRDSRQATKIAHYFAAVDRYLTTGNADWLVEFRGQAVKVDGKSYQFVTDRKTIDRLGHAGEVSFEDLYARAA